MKLLLIALVAVTVCHCAFADDAVDEVQFESLKVKDLKAFLADRGVECVGCSEKTHLVARAKEVKDMPKVERKPETPAKVKPAAADTSASQGETSGRSGAGSNSAGSARGGASSGSGKGGKFGDVWGAKAEKVCEGAKAAGASLSCSEFGGEVRRAFSEFTGNLASALGKSDSTLKETSLKEPYNMAGERQLKKLYAQKVVQEKVSRSDLKKAVSQELSQWLLNTAMENPSQMFGGMDMDDIMAQLKKGNFGGQGQQAPRRERKAREPEPEADHRADDPDEDKQEL